MKDKELYSTIQVDVDGFWVIQKLLGRTVPLEPDPVFTLGLDRLLTLLWEFNVKATFFVVARDLESQQKTAVLRKVAAAGHEIASHGLSHRYLSLLDEDQTRREIKESKEKIEAALGVKINGFKAAGFAASNNMAGMLEEAGYSYDSSVFATSCASLMELVSKVSYPKMGMMTAPSRPYHPSKDNIFKKGDSSIMEIPVTTVPFIRTPAHFSYMIAGGSAYANLVRGLIRASSSRPINYLFHPLDFVDGSSISIEEKVYGLNIDAGVKLEMAKDMLKFLCRGRKAVTTMELCGILKE